MIGIVRFVSWRIPMIEPLPVERSEIAVVHVAHIHHWPQRTRQESDRADLFRPDSLWEAAREGDPPGRDETYLTHYGRCLDAAAALPQHPRRTLPGVERLYPEARRRRRQRAARRHRPTRAAVIAA